MNRRRTHRITIVEEGGKRVIAIIAGILVVKQFREEEFQRERRQAACSAIDF